MHGVQQGTRIHLPALILIAIAVAVVYSICLGGTWAMDDLVARRPVQMHDLRDFVGSRKVALLTFLLNQYIAPFSAFSFRLFNVFLHFFNSVLVYSLAYATMLLSGEHGPADAAGNKDLRKRALTFAALVGLLFALHPLNINAVAYIVQRMALLAAFFVLLSLLSYIAAWRSQTKMGTAVLYFSSFVFLMMGIFSKENAAIAVPLILLYDYIFLSKFNFRSFFKRLLIILVLAAISIGFALNYLKLDYIFMDNVRIFMNFNKPLPERGWTAIDVYWTPLQHILTEFRVICRYMFLVFLPLPQFLVFDWWGYSVSTGVMEPATTLAAILFIASIVIFSVWEIRRFPMLSFGILWYFIGLSLESFLMPGLDLYFEHRNYLPLAGLFVGAVGQILSSFKINQKALLSVSAALCIALGLMTFTRNHVWKDSITLWSDTVNKNPSNLRALMSLGNAYLMASDSGNAERSYIRAVKISSDQRRVNYFNDAAYSLGMIYLSNGELAKAKQLIDRFDQVVESYRPKILKAYYSALTGDADRAIGGYKEVLQEAGINATDTVVIYTLLGDAYRSENSFDDAVDSYKKALSIDPSFASAYYGMGNAYMSKRDLPLALEYLKKTLDFDPENSFALSDIADITLVRHSNPEKALAYARRAVSTNPGHYRPYLTMGNILIALGREREADEFYRKALGYGMQDYMVPFSKARTYYIIGKKEDVTRCLNELRKFKNLPDYIQVVISRK